MRTPLEDFTVDCFMFTFNEVDIIGAVASHAISQGVRLHVMDNWSTDGTWDELRGLPLASLKRFPETGPIDRFELASMLREFERLSAESQADWIMIQDADEIRRAASGETLREAFWRAENEGFNAVNFAVVLFPPIDEGFQRGMDPEKYFRWYQAYHLHTNLPHVKAWKNQEDQHVSIVESGSHNTTFPGRLVTPEIFWLKHYPIRGQSHGEKKIFMERNPRFPHEEVYGRGWHVQYQGIQAGHSFLRHIADLVPWQD